MIDHIKIERPRPGVLCIRHSRRGAMLSLLYHLMFFGIVYWAVFGTDVLKDVPRHWMWAVWILMMWPLLFVSRLKRLVNTIRKSRVYEFDGQAKVVRLNGETLNRFDNIRAIDLLSTTQPDTPEQHVLSLVLEDGSETKLADTTNGDRAAEAEAAISEMLERKVGGLEG